MEKHGRTVIYFPEFGKLWNRNSLSDEKKD